MVIAGIVIVVATFIAIIKQFETRLVLLLSGLLMCFIELSLPVEAFFSNLCGSGSQWNSFERKVVHDVVRDEGLKSRSHGEEPHRYV